MTAAVAAATAVVLAIAVWLAWCRAHLVTVVVTGSSMAPALSAHDRVVVRRVPGHRLAAGQVVVFAAPFLEAGSWVWRPPGDLAAAWSIKRIVAVAGDPVPAAVAWASGAVPAGSIVVLGDNRAASADSRLFGHVPIECVLGYVMNASPRAFPAR